MHYILSLFDKFIDFIHIYYVKNIVVEVTGNEQALRVKKYWIDRGITTDLVFFWNPTHVMHYYGVINGVFHFYTKEEVNNAGAKIVVVK